MTLGVAHREGDLVVVDAVREIVAPFDPDSATEEFAEVPRSYGLRHVTGDRWRVGPPKFRET
jgi:hypothetical protein